MGITLWGESERGNMVTIKEIAKLAGVSHATVSMVINGKKGPGEEVRERVKRIVDETGYVPNMGARNLVMKKGSNVGIFLLNFPEKREDRLFYYYTELMGELVLKMREHGYTILFYTDKDGTRGHISYADYCREQNLMCAIFLGMNYDDPNLKELKNLTSTQIIMFDLVTGGEYNTIISNSDSGIMDMISHLESQGKNRLAVVTGTGDSLISTVKKAEYLKKLGREKNFLVEFLEGNFYKKSGYEIGKKLNVTKYDAVFAMNDAMGIGVVEALKERRIRIPEDISVIGYDNMLFTDYTTPKLSSIAHDNREICEKLFEIIKSGAKNREVHVETKFISKESC